MKKIICMQTEYKDSPLGMDENSPRFFYRLECGKSMQQQRRIKVRKDSGALVWDSGLQISSDTIQIPY